MIREQEFQPSLKDDIGLGEIVVALSLQWRMIVSFAVLGLLIAVLSVSSMKTKYAAESSLSLPTHADTQLFNSKDLLSLSRSELFNSFLDLLKSETNFASYLKEENLTNRYATELQIKNDESLIFFLLKSLNIETKSPLVAINQAPLPPTEANLKLKLPVEGLLLNQTLSGYLSYTTHKISNNWYEELRKVKQSKLESIAREISEIRNRAKLERLRKIEFTEKQNSIRIEELKLEKRLLMQLENRNITTELAEVKEAKEIANALGIVKPKTLTSLSSAEEGPITNVNLASQQELPLYLMGTKYLEALSKALDNRKDNSVFLRELTKIEKQLDKLINDPVLQELKTRESDDPFIEELPKLLAYREKINSSNISMEDVSLYTEVQSVYTYVVNDSMKKVITILSVFLFSCMLGIIAALVRISVLRFKSRSRSQSSLF